MQTPQPAPRQWWCLALSPNAADGQPANRQQYLLPLCRRRKTGKKSHPYICCIIFSHSYYLYSSLKFLLYVTITANIQQFLHIFKLQIAWVSAVLSTRPWFYGYHSEQLSKNDQNIRNLILFWCKIKLPYKNLTKQKERIPYGLFYIKYLHFKTKNFNFYQQDFKTPFYTFQKTADWCFVKLYSFWN